MLQFKIIVAHSQENFPYNETDYSATVAESQYDEDQSMSQSDLYVTQNKIQTRNKTDLTLPGKVTL